jgi:hypothetical protein
VRLARPVTVIACALALACAGSAAAQGMTPGVRGGINLANLNFDVEGEEPSLDQRFGAVAGVFFTLPLISRIELQPEVLYSSKGARLDDDGIQSTLVLDYLEVPVLARLSGTAFGTRRFYVIAGPTVGVRLRAKSRTEFSGSTEEIEFAEEVERLDFGVAAGGGLEFGALLFDARYTIGLRDIDRDRTDQVKISNRVFSLTAGWRF